MKISAVILSKNEERNIARAIKSVLFCDEIIIVDDFSTDKTLDSVHKILRGNKKYKILSRAVDGDFARQRTFAMSKAENDWVLYLDADEEVSARLKDEIVSLFRNPSGLVQSVFYLKRRDFYRGREMKFGETGKIRESGIIRLIRKDSGNWEGKVHEIYKVKAGITIGKTLHQFINHYPHQSVREFLQEVNYYSSLRALELAEKGIRSNIFEIIFYPLGKFIFTYFIKLGFLDGPEGFIYAFFMSFHSFLVRSKLFLK